MTASLCASAILLSGEAEGPVLRLDRPLSFWGGVDPRTGVILDPRHPQYGAELGGRILAMERTIGSSSGSSVMLELLAIGKAPAGLILTEPDAILTLGVIVAREMGYGSLPVFLVSPDTLAQLPASLAMHANGELVPQGEHED